MKYCKGCEQISPVSDFSANRGAKDGLQHYCKSCMKKRYQKWRKENPERFRIGQLSWQAKNAERVRATRNRWAAKNPAHVYRPSTDADRERARRWAKEHPAESTAQANAKRAAKLNATPKWANQFFIAEAYHIARLRSQMTGVKHHVDHIVPLQSQLVCGLHVEHNLAVIPAVQNISKGNRHWPDMPSDSFFNPPASAGFFSS